MKQHLHGLAIFFLSSLPLFCQPALELAGLFSDHMVVQRDRAVPVWGRAAPGDEVTLDFADQTKTALADERGQWSLVLDPMEAHAVGRTLLVRSRRDTKNISVNDVLVGDVWLCSGQSNMHFRMQSVENAKQEMAAMNFPRVRFLTVNQQFGQEPLTQIKAAWNPLSPASAAECSAVACYFGTALHKEKNIPIGLIISSVGGTRIESWMRRETLAATGESRSLIDKWKDMPAVEFEQIGKAYSAYQHQRDHVHPMALGEARAQGRPAPAAPVAPKLRCHDCPSALHNGMIAPLQPYALRGAIWYQGESNAGQPKPYQKLLPAMIADWRGVWGKDMPFLFVQLAPHRSIHPSFREAQHQIWQNTPHTAMVVTTDVGDAGNIHPARKRPVGERLAIAARSLSYGETIVSSGPVFQAMTIKNDRAIISFDHVGQGLIANNGALRGFSLAGQDGKFLPAEAVIEGRTVVVSSARVSQPVAVRYNWAIMPEGNLHNREGLPAPPFRTDSSNAP